MIPCLIIFIAFLVLFTFQLRKNTKAQSEEEEKFWQREQQANSTRKQDISTLSYIELPAELIPGTLHTEAEDELLSLQGQKMLNLTTYSNTDLKLMYGVSNLDTLTDFESAYVKMIAAISVYSKELQEAGDTENAQKLLEFAVACHDDSFRIYATLATLYKETGQSERIHELTASAEELDSISKNAILAHLRELL